MIKASNIVKTFERGFWRFKTFTPVLKGFDFEARPGEVTGLLGPNGAGKTTFFRIVCGLETITDGSIEVNGFDPSLNPIALRGLIALLPEDPGVARHQSGRDHLFVFGAMMGLSRAEIAAAMNAADDILHMSSYWSRDFSTYSRGQKARIALARMKMMPSAQVFIFDEPSNGLDFEAVTRLHGFIRSLADDGKTILVASHILSDLRHLCDRLVGIDDGRAANPEKMNAWLAAHARAQAVTSSPFPSSTASLDPAAVTLPGNAAPLPPPLVVTDNSSPPPTSSLTP